MKRRQLAKAAAMVAIAGLVSTSATRNLSAENEGDGRRLEGTWLFQISLQNCATEAPVGEPFYSLLTFARGGTMTETTSNPMFFPAERGPGHGAWAHAGDRTYKAVTKAFITLNGELTKIQTITQTLDVVDDDHVKTTAAKVTFTKPDGTLLAQGCAVATGKRVEVDGLD